ncbi:MAG: CocE/NonD family hydrolase [Aggregatilineales bacterium]
MKSTWKMLLFLGGIAGYMGYRARRQLIARVLNLPLPQHEVAVTTGIQVAMSDGVNLVHDYYAPVELDDAPTVLIRSPYGRNISGSVFGAMLGFFAERFAERGYHVVLQDVRGRFEAGGEFRPYLNESDDAHDTVVWLREQDWFNGTLGLWGASYLGIVQWLLVNRVPEVKAIMPIFAATELRDILFHDEALDYGLAMRWLSIFHVLDRLKSNPILNLTRYVPMIESRSRKASTVFPARNGDASVTGQTVDFYQEWLENELEDSLLWADGREMLNMDATDAAVHFIGGWYDFFLREQLEDYARLRDNGLSPQLTIGAWAHFDEANGMIPGIREGLRWFDHHLKGHSGKVRGLPVRLFVIGANEWREYPSFPPPSTETAYYLHPGRKLSTAIPEASETVHYTYDPANPTPALGGAMFAFDTPVKDNRALESRPDVLTFTTDILTQDVEAIGYVRLQLYVSSSLAHTDFFGRLCDVQPDGRSLNICDGLFRVKPGKGTPQSDGSICIEVQMWVTAYHFKRGHQIRLQVSSGAHPRWLANPGTGASLLDDNDTMHIAHQSIYIGKDTPSALFLPIVSAG